ncbi:lysozyme inhibitor LprI family protein [Sphingomonas sp. RT2P30]|uniref:lysozyme inhibitor LprI family protein n=1 Tax=Parasphingomonas halimpatiens TaxID=3096162 RepID=UPI003FA74216
MRNEGSRFREMAMWRRLVLTVCTFILATQPALAQEDGGGDKFGFSVEHDRCINAARGITSLTLSCNGEEAARQDERLNQAYREVMGRLDSRQRLILRRLECRWLSRRRVYCAKVAEPAGRERFPV